MVDLRNSEKYRTYTTELVKEEALLLSCQIQNILNKLGLCAYVCVDVLCSCFVFVLFLFAFSFLVMFYSYYIDVNK